MILKTRLSVLIYLFFLLCIYASTPHLKFFSQAMVLMKFFLGIKEPLILILDSN